MPVFSMQAVDTTVEQSLFSERMLAMLSAAFGLVATLLAAIGLYGVMAYTVSRRTREIGIRIALGAERRTVLWLVLREVAFITIAGIALAIPAALALGGVVRSQLFGVSAADPWTMALASLGARPWSRWWPVGCRPGGRRGCSHCWRSVPSEAWTGGGPRDINPRRASPPSSPSPP